MDSRKQTALPAIAAPDENVYSGAAPEPHTSHDVATLLLVQRLILLNI